MSLRYKIAYGMELAAGQCCLVRAGGRMEPQLLAAAPPDSDEIRGHLEGIAREVARGSAALAVAVPAELTVTRRLRAPFASSAKAARIWDSLLDVDLPFPIESALRSYSAPRVEGKETIALAAAIRQTDLAAFLEACRPQGIQPTHCDAAALALWSQQILEAPPARAHLARILIWLGHSHAMVLRGRGPEFWAAHVLRVSPLNDPESFAQILSARLPAILQSHQEESGCEEMDGWWAGPGAEQPDLLARLQKRLPATLRLRHGVHRQPSWLLARALARRAADGSGVNFRAGEWVHPAVRAAATRRMQRAHGGLIAAAVLLLALNAGERLGRRKEAEQVQQDLTAAARAIAGEAVPRGQELLMVERTVARRDEETRYFREALDPVGVEGRLVRLLEIAAAGGVEIKRLALSVSALQMEGTVANIQTLEQVAEQLRRENWAVHTESSGRAPDGRHLFLLKGGPPHAE